MKRFDAKLAALANVPEALPHEAPNSWLMRTAALQGCTSKEFADYLGFTFKQDIDLAYYFVFRKTRPVAPQVQALEAGRMYVDLSRTPKKFGYMMNAPGGYRGRYRFCPLCLHAAQVPCIHLYTRMEELIICPWHRCLLEEQCPHCDAHVDLMRNMIEPVRGKPGVEDLSRCMRCRQPLHAAKPLFADSLMRYDMPSWLLDCGRDGPGPVAWFGMDRRTYAAHRARLAKAAARSGEGTPTNGAGGVGSTQPTFN